MEEQIKELETRKTKLDKKVEELKAKKESIEERNEERMAIEKKTREDEIEFLKYQESHLQKYLKSVTDNQPQ